MAERKRINITVPIAMLKEIDRLVGGRRGSRSQLMMEAMKLYLSMRRHQLRESLRAGYEEMAPINLALAEEGLLAENECHFLAVSRPAGAD